MKYKTIREATEGWVREFNAIPLSVLKTIERHKPGSVMELTEPSEDADGYFPMWGTVWTFYDSVDDWWAENHIDVMQECGFRVYDQEDFGIIFGIDGAGYNFYEAHWVPLYKARGLQWHEQEQPDFGGSVK